MSEMFLYCFCHGSLWFYKPGAGNVANQFTAIMKFYFTNLAQRLILFCYLLVFPFKFHKMQHSNRIEAIVLGLNYFILPE